MIFYFNVRFIIIFPVKFVQIFNPTLIFKIQLIFFFANCFEYVIYIFDIILLKIIYFLIWNTVQICSERFGKYLKKIRFKLYTILKCMRMQECFIFLDKLPMHIRYISRMSWKLLNYHHFLLSLSLSFLFFPNFTLRCLFFIQFNLLS